MQRLVALRPAIATLLAGVLVGYTLAGFTETMVADSQMFGTHVETPQAHQFMVSLLAGDPDALAKLRPPRDVATRALELNSVKASTTGGVKPTALTYLGGRSVGPVDVQIYVVRLHVPDSDDQLISFA